MAREDFRRGMLYGFAAVGLTPSEVGELVIDMKKQASWGGLTGLGSSLGDGALAFTAGVPLAAGALLGAGAYQISKPDYKANIDALRTQDIINEIRLRKRDVQRNLARKGVTDGLVQTGKP
jgi:hypothetical protein